ncbi:hypothetical protein BDV93DRAFT_527431 [Ceratobasidium sp. AG-I]|nr:hypothetical protein BDV93DRAFT_527431 [Ceratobasidium sp. AG-I]
MPPAAETDEIPAPAPSFNDFSFKQIGMAKPSLLARLNMFSQPEPPPELPTSVSPSPEISMDTSAPLTSETTSPALGIDTTSTSSLPPYRDAPTHQDNIIVQEVDSLNQPRSALAPNPVLSTSTSPMEVDELIDSDVFEFTPVRETNHPPRIPESYRALSADHYLVAPPADFPYPRSPVFRFSEGHPLYVAPSLFAHLPRAPPRSPRLDPLAILELESERERSEWEQVRKVLVRPSPDLFSIAPASTRSPEVSLSAPITTSAASAEASSPVLAPVVPSEAGYDSDSSGVELHVYDNVPASEANMKDGVSPPSNFDATIARTSLSPNSNDISSAQPLGLTTLATAQEETPLVTNPPVRRLSPNRLPPTSEVPLPKPSVPDAAHTGPAVPLVSNEQVGTPERSSTPSKRKFDAIEGLAGKHGNGLTSTTTSRQASTEASRSRLGVPPPFRAQVDRVPVAKAATAEPPAPPHPVTTETTSSPTNTPLEKTPQPSHTSSQPSASSTPGPQDNGELPAERRVCRFHNRPPGRVCIRKEACPDLHQGPLMKPLTVASYLFTTTTPPGTSAFPARPLSSADRHVPPPCAFFFSVGCNRGNECAFSHDTASRERSHSAPHTTPQTNTFPIATTGPNEAQAQGQAPQIPSMSQSPPATQALRKEGQIPPPKPMAQASQTQRAQNKATAATTKAAPLPPPGPAGSARQGPIPQPQPQTRSTMPRVSPGTSAVPKPATPAPPPAMKQENISITHANVKVKAERPSPSPNPVKKVAPLPKKLRKAAQATPASLKIKEEDVTLYDLAGEPGVPADEEMADGATGASDAGPILPTSISAPIQPTPAPKKKDRARARVQAETLAKPPTPARQPLPLPAKPPPSVTSAAVVPPPPTLTTVVIPPTPVPIRAPTAKKAATVESQRVPPRKTPSPILPQPARRQHSSDSRRPILESEPEQRELANRVPNPPPRRVSERQLRSDSYRRTYGGEVGGRRSSSRSNSPPRSRGQSPSRSRSRSRSPPPMRRNNGNGNPARRPWSRRSPSPARFDRYEHRDEDPRFLARPGYRFSSRSRSPDGRRYPTSSQNERGPIRRASPPRGIHSHWSSRSPISRSPSPLPPPLNAYRRSSHEDRDQGYRPITDTRPPPRTRSPLPQLGSVGNRGYAHDGNYRPQEAEIPRVWETNSRPPASHLGQARNEGTVGTNQNMQDISSSEQGHPRSSRESGRGAKHEASTGRIDYPIEPPPANSTLGRLSPSAEDFRRISERTHMAPSNNYDDFEQSMTMEMSSPPLSPLRQLQTQGRLQDRVNAPPVPVYADSGAENGASLFARMGHDNDLAARMTSSQNNQANNLSSHSKWSKSNSYDNRGQLASRLGVSTGEKSQSLANRLVGDSQSRSTYQGRTENRESSSRGSEMIGGGLMARLVGKKPA